MPKYPEIIINLVGEDSNAFSILGLCVKEAKSTLSKDEIEEFKKEATKGDFDNLICVVCKWFTVN
jgi:hypothetical protein